MALPPPPEGLDLAESQIPAINGSVIGMFTLSTIVFALRLVARRIQNNRLWVEDWLAFVGWMCAGAQGLVTVGYMVPNGTGLHVWAGPPTALKAWSLGLFISEITYSITVLCVKYSTLFFYWRIFSTRESIRLPIWILGGVVTLWTIGVLTVELVQCLPTYAFWERYDPIHPLSPKEFSCDVQLTPFFKANAIPNIITDGCIVLLPMPYVWQLQLQRAQRIAVSGIFALGAFVTVVSILRLNFILAVDLSSPDVTWNFNSGLIWSNVECFTAVICVCLPALKPLFTLALKGTLKSSGDYGSSGPQSGHMGSKYIVKSNAGHSSHVTSGLHKGPSGFDDNRPFARLDETESVGAGRDLELQNIGRNAPKPAGITVTREFIVGNGNGRQ